MTDDPKTGPDLVAKHAELIGRVALQWSDLHRIMGELFDDFSVSEEARKRYWATQSDRVQRQLVLSVGSVALQEFPDLRDKLEQTLAEIERLAGDRNAAIHSYWAIDLPAGKVLPIGVSLRTSACAMISRFNSKN